MASKQPSWHRQDFEPRGKKGELKPKYQPIRSLKKGKLATTENTVIVRRSLKTKDKENHLRIKRWGRGGHKRSSNIKKQRTGLAD